jgi:hypothetical protein
MNTKTTVILIVIIVVAVLGFWYFGGGSVSVAPTISDDGSGMIEISDRDVLEQIMADIESQEPLNIDESFSDLDRALEAL